MDDKKRLFMGALFIVLFLAGSARPGTNAVEMTAVGDLHWTRISVCEWPIGHFLNYYLTDDCGRELFFSGDSLPADKSWDGACVWATGIPVVNGSCNILAVTSVDVCVPPEPPAPD